jgi:hypothetical protein
MYKYLLIICIAIVSISCHKEDCGCNNTDITLDSLNLKSDLILHYTFEDGSANDISGFKNHGKVLNQAFSVKGIKGNGLQLIGKDTSTDQGGYVFLPRLKFEKFGDFSINIWVNEQDWTYSGGNAYISWGDENTGILGIFSQWGRPRYDLNRHTKFAVGSTWSFDEDPYDPNNILMLDQYYPEYTKINTWVFYTLNYKNGIIYAYRNAKLIASQKQEVKISMDSAGINRHWWHNGTKTCSRMTGIVDELRIYKRALKESEINTLFKEKE